MARISTGDTVKLRLARAKSLFGRGPMRDVGGGWTDAEVISLGRESTGSAVASVTVRVKGRPWPEHAARSRFELTKVDGGRWRDLTGRLVFDLRAPKDAPERNFQIPPKQKAETWVQYHDRLSNLASQAVSTGSDRAAAALERRAGEIARKHKEVRTKIRSGASAGPGTYPWEVCIAQAKKRGSNDPKAVCGAIRAASRRKYPAYWQKRSRKRKNPTTDYHEEEARADMDAAASSLAEALQQKQRAKAFEWAMSASMYAGSAMAHAEAAENAGLRLESGDLAQSIRKLTDEYIFAPLTLTRPGASPRQVAQNSRKGKKASKERQKSKKGKGEKKPTRNPAISRFMRL